MQTLEITGSCFVEVEASPGYYTNVALTRTIGVCPRKKQFTNASILDLFAAPKPIQPNYFLAAWTGQNNYTYCRVDPATGQVKLTLAIPDKDPDMLKVTVLGRAFDPETQLTKNFPIVSGALDLRKITTRERAVTLTNPFDTNKINFKFTASAPVDPLRLTSSALREIQQWNNLTTQLSNSMKEAYDKNCVHVPAAGQGFLDGITCLPGGGGDVEHIQAHDGVLSAVVDRLDRQIPHVLLAYFQHLYFVHHGRTARELLAMDDARFSKEMFNIFPGTTRDAAFNPYQPDRTWDVLRKTDGIFTSENIGNPLPAGVKVGARVIKKRDLPPLPDIRADYNSGDYAAAFKKLGRYMHDNSVEPQNIIQLYLMMDDCETSQMMIQMCISTIARGDMSKAAFSGACATHPCFANYADEDYGLVSEIFQRCQCILNSGTVSTGSVVGLAGGASAGTASATGGGTQDINEVVDAGGHCFGFAKIQTKDQFYVRFIEGTTCVDVVDVNQSTPVYTVLNSDTKELMSMPADKFLTIFAKSFGGKSQIINSVIADEHEGAGVAGQTPIAGFARDQVSLKSLHDHAPNEDMMFYKWVMYAGLPRENAAGVVPVDHVNTKGRLELGCHPALFASQAVNGFPTEMNEKHIELGARILQEAWQPQVDTEHIKKVMELWQPLEKLSELNTSEYNPHPDQFYRVTCMESPASPELVEPLYQMHKILERKVNEINFHRPNSDQFRYIVTKVGTGVHKTVCIPKRNVELTFISALEQAKEELGWVPASTPLSAAMQGKLEKMGMHPSEFKKKHGDNAHGFPMGCTADCPSGSVCVTTKRRHHHHKHHK